ncbi:MAG: LysE family translocator [Acetobacteraceae bacterium]|nr:LysE family translocator [Acetobacteraceae bacterium]
MDALTLAGFAGALALATASPGPAITALVARVLARGAPGIAAFCAGLILGDLIWLGIAVFGLALIAEAAQPLLVALKWGGVGFLLFLAWKAWTAPAAALPTDAPPPPGEGARLFLTALLLTLGNPKVVLFYTSVTPALIDVERVGAGDFALLGLVLVAVFAAVQAGYVWAALRARHLLRSPRAMRAVNRGAGVAMAGAAVAVATR